MLLAYFFKIFLRIKVLVLALVVLIDWMFPVFGMATEIPKTRDAIKLSFAPLVKRTGPAVVNIFARTQRMERVKSPLFADPFFEQFFGKLFERRPQMRNHQSLGSGVVIKPNGIVVTNNHVIAGATEVKVVFSNNKNAPGLSFAKENNLEAITLDYHNFKNTEEYEEKIISLLKPYDLELICLAGYMKILSKKLIDHYPNKIINIHPSLLPEYKGLNTHRRVLENNEIKTGCTVHYVNQEMDGGEVILQREVDINAEDTENSIAQRVLKEEHIIYPEAIKLVLTK